MLLKDRLAEYIRTYGPLATDEYMLQCNTHYYATRDPLGAAGDFTTASEISQIFGELVGVWLLDQWQRIGTPYAVLCELGPGRGTLMSDVLRTTKRAEGFHDSVAVALVETSPTLQGVQAKTLEGTHPRLLWQESVDTLPALPLLLIANEFFDALPVKQEVQAGDLWVPRRVGLDGDKFAWQPEDKTIRESSPASLAVMAKIAAHIHKHGGAALIVDYGYTSGEQGNTLQAVKNHAYADPLVDPGEADLTAHVDFRALASAARKTNVWDAVEQGTFLKRLGAELRATALCKNATSDQRTAVLAGLERLVAPHQMGSLFKVLALTSSLDKPAGF